MREYRGKRLSDGEWVKGYYYQENKAEVGFTSYGDHDAYDIVHMIKEHYADNFKDFEVDPNTVSQATGLKDKNGKMIYEGDVLVLDLTGTCDGKHEVTVKWDKQYLGFCIYYGNGDKDWLCENDSDNYEIVGSIHD